MKKAVTSVVLALSMAAGLTACGSATPTKTVTVTAQAQSQDDTLTIPSSSGLVDAVRTADPWWNAGDAGTIEDTAQSICSAFRNGASLQDVMSVAEGTIGLEHLPAIVAGAIVYDCPDQAYKVQ